MIPDAERYSPDGLANHHARNRARERARHRTAMHFHAEYDRYLAEQTGGQRAPTNTEEARAKRKVQAAHPRTYQRFHREQLESETLIPLHRGAAPRFPHGTRQAWTRHNANDEKQCADCLAWWEAKNTHTCEICGRVYVDTLRKRFCGPPCRDLWQYLRYWANKTERIYAPQEAPWERATIAKLRAQQVGVDLAELVARWRAS